MSNILIVSTGWSNRKNPVGNFEFDQAVALKKSGHNVQVFALDIRTILHSRQMLAYDMTLEGIKIKVIPLHIRFLPERVKYSIGKFFLALFYNKYVKSENIDIIHAHWGPYCFLISKLAKQLHIPLVMTEHNSLVNMPNPKSDYFKISAKGYLAADKLLCVSSCLKKNLRLSTGLEFEVVPNVLDPLIFNEDFQIHEHRNSGCIELISVGHLLPIKNFELLIQCINKLNNKNIKLRIFGEGYLQKELQGIIDSYDLHDNIKLEGNVERKNLVAALLRSDAFILLSKSETFGVAFIEAMACGLPVFSSKCGGTDDIIVSDKYGMISKSFEIEDIVKDLIYFLDHLNKYDRNEISAYALERFSKAVLAGHLSRIYNGL